MPYQAGFIFGPSPYDSSCLANTRSSRAALGLPSLACRVPYQAGFISRPSPGVFTWQSLGVREAHLGPPRKGQGGPCSITHMAMCFFFDWVALYKKRGLKCIISTYFKSKSLLANRNHSLAKAFLEINACKLRTKMKVILLCQYLPIVGYLHKNYYRTLTIK